MASLITLVDGTIAVVAPVNQNFTALNDEVRSVNRGGTGMASLTAGSLLVGNGTSPIVPVVGSAGQILVIPVGGGNPDFIDVSALPTVQTGHYNYIYNGDFEIWGTGNTAATLRPTGWGRVSGVGTVSKATGAGQFISGTGSAFILLAPAQSESLFQRINEIYPPVAQFASRQMTAGVWMWSDIPSGGFIQLRDNGTFTTVAHPGDAAWHWLTATLTVGASPTGVIFFLGATLPGTYFFDQATVVDGPYLPRPIPDGWRGRKAIMTFSSGSVNMTVNPTYYGSGNASTTEVASNYLLTPFRGIARNLSVGARSNPGVGVEDRLRITNTADTALLVTFTAGVNFGVDTTHEQEFAKSIYLNMRTSDSASNPHTATLEYEEMPPGLS
jgi:hypothetical protein